MKIAVITASIGGIDLPKKMPVQDIDFDFYSFTDKNSPFPFIGIDNRLKAKYFKIQAHKLFPDYDIIVWMDGNIQVKRNDFIRKIVEHLNYESDMVISKHPMRGCVYEETNFIIDEIAKGSKYLKARYNPEALKKEMAFFKTNGHPENAGLYWCGLFARRNNAKVNAFFDSWWEDNILWANFDQTNFVYQQLKHNIKLSTINLGPFYENDNYELINHSKLM